MYSKFDIIVIIVCAVAILGIYIFRKAMGEMWYGINWRRVFYEIRRGACKLLLKAFNK